MMQGLDALAAASDAATQADRNEQQRLQRNDYNGELTPQQSIAANQMNGHHSVPSPTASTYTGAPIAVQHQVESNKSLPAYAPVQVQWGQANHMFGAPNSAATSAAAAAMFQAALAQNPVMAKTGGAETYNAMQHLAYYQFIQSQAVAQIAQMGSSQNFFDQNAALAFAGQQAVSQLQGELCKSCSIDHDLFCFSVGVIVVFFYFPFLRCLNRKRTQYRSPDDAIDSSKLVPCLGSHQHLFFEWKNASRTSSLRI